MRTLSTAARRAIFEPETDEVFLVLLTITGVGLATPLRFVNNSSDVVSAGSTYLAYPFQISLPDEREDSPAQERAESGAKPGAPEAALALTGADLAIERNSSVLLRDRRAASRELRQPILLQVRLGGEASKAGVEEGGLPALAAQVCRLPQLELRGLMCIPPPVEHPEQARRWFARLRELREALLPEVGPLPELSMGMSHDFEIAIEEGATLVRVGRAIFGERPRPPAG